MADTEKIIAETMERIQGLLSSERVVGEAITIGETTIVPLVSIGFGIGGGSGTESGAGNNTGGGYGAGGGGGIRPVALVISDANGVRVESVKQGSSSLAEALSAAVKHFAEQHTPDASTGDETGSSEKAKSSGS